MGAAPGTQETTVHGNSDSTFRLLGGSLSMEIAALKEVVYQQQVLINWIIKARRDNQAQCGCDIEVHLGSTRARGTQLMEKSHANVIANVEILLERQSNDQVQESVSRFDPSFRLSDETAGGREMEQDSESSMDTLEFYEDSIRQDMSKDINRAWSRANAWKPHQMSSTLMLQRDAEELSNDEALKSGSSEKCAIVKLFAKKSYCKVDKRRCCVKWQTRAALPSASWSKPGTEREHQRDTILAKDTKCGKTEFVLQFGDCFRVSGGNRWTGNSSMWKKRETHVAFREGEG